MTPILKPENYEGRSRADVIRSMEIGDRLCFAAPTYSLAAGVRSSVNSCRREGRDYRTKRDPEARAVLVERLA